MKKGTQAWLTGHLRNVSKIYNNETKVYDSLMNHAKRETKGSKVDLLEVFAGSANVTIRAWKHGLSALEPIDQQYNLDLSRPQVQTPVDTGCMAVHTLVTVQRELELCRPTRRT